MDRVSSRRIGLRVVVAVLVLGGLILAQVSPVSGDAEGEGWLHPVDASVVDPFRPPATRFGAGNRGIEYDTDIGDPVKAVDDGRVVWAGVVGDARHITIDHGNGLRSTSAYLATIHVVRGQEVERGAVIGTAGADFHLTARLGDTYVDPELLFAGAVVVLALTEGPSSPAPPASSAPMTRREWGGVSAWNLLVRIDAATSLSGVVERSAEAGRRWQEQECELGGAPSGGLPSGGIDTAGAADRGSGLAGGGGGDHGDGRILIQVGGLGSSSGEASIGLLDASALGYDAADVIGFSYAGGCTPTPFGSTPVEGSGSLGDQLDANPYGPSDTYGDIDIAAGHLADLVEAAADERPGQPIDITAHSLGGVVARRALEILAGRPGAVLPDTLVTIGSPHGGANLAEAALPIEPGSTMGETFDRIDRVADVWDAISVAQVATSGPRALDPPGEPPADVRVVSIGGATDLIVPLSSTYWEGAVNIAIESDLRDAGSLHGRLPGLAEVAEEVGLAVSGQSASCRSLTSHLISVGKSSVIQRAEDLVGAGVAILSALD